MRVVSEKDMALFLFSIIYSALTWHFIVVPNLTKSMMESTQKNEPTKKRIVIIRIKETETVCMQTE